MGRAADPAYYWIPSQLNSGRWVAAPTLPVLISLIR